MLQTAHHKTEGENGQEDLKRGETMVRTVTIGDSIDGLVGSGKFSLGEKTMRLIGKEGEGTEEGGLNGAHCLSIERMVGDGPVSPRLYIATGLGIIGNCFGGNGGGVDLLPLSFDEIGDAEKYYKRMVDEYPCHPLFLRNYAQLLQSKGDLHGAEECYHRAELADPEDGNILLQSAKLAWELHHDQEKALSYFERAAQASSNDSYALAAYASFLWEIDDDADEEHRSHQMHIQNELKETLDELNNSTLKADNELVIPFLQLSAGLVADADKGGGNVEDSYRRMVEENPCNPLVLRNYAYFLQKSKGDLQGAEDYYSRAILADPGDGETMSQYAKLVWELHHDLDKASCFFEQAVQATSRDSHVLAAYTRFLWETAS